MKASAIVPILITAALASADAQWLHYRDATIPRTRDGRPNLSAPAPRVNGKPDLSGLWEAERTPVSEFVRVLGPGVPQIQPDLNDVTKHVINVFWDLKPEEWPLRPETAALTQQRQRSGRDFQTAYCQPASLPASTLVLNVKMIQSPGEIVVLAGNGDPARQIYIDGRDLPKDPEPSWMGSSVGHWQGDSLVVETTGFNDRAWLDGFGHPRSESMRITERYRRRDVGHMDLEVTIDDPKYYTRPFGFKTTLTLVPDSDVLEYVCTENEKDTAHMSGAQSARNAIQGVWRVVEATTTGTGARTIPFNGRPTLTIITAKHYSRVEVQADGPRPILADVAKASADELRAVWGPFVSEAGTYETTPDGVITMRPIASKNPAVMGPGVFIAYSYKVNGDTLSLTQLRNQNGPFAAPFTLKLARVE